MSVVVDTLKASVEADLATLPVPADQVRYLADTINTLVGLQTVYAERRRSILTQMRATMSATEIAAELGLSRARVYQILRGA